MELHDDQEGSDSSWESSPTPRSEPLSKLAHLSSAMCMLIVTIAYLTEETEAVIYTCMDCQKPFRNYVPDV